MSIADYGMKRKENIAVVARYRSGKTYIHTYKFI